ncbi:unnamed protein product [Closterium sp. NIES-64]|nr:unnamed protein product [Closterium sp. NIES-64]
MSVPYSLSRIPVIASIRQEDAVLLRYALRHGTRQWGRLVRGRQLARGNKACCNRFLFLKNSAPTLGSLPALDWPLSFATSLTPSITPSFASSLSPSFSPSLASSLSPTHVSITHPYLSSHLTSASPWQSTSRTPFTFGLLPSFPALHSALPHSLSPSLGSTIPPHAAPPTATPTTSPIALHSPLTSPPSATPSPSSHRHSAAPFTPTSPITAATPPPSSQCTAAPMESQQLQATSTPSAGEASAAAPHPSTPAPSASMLPKLPVPPVLPPELTESMAPAAALPTPLYHASMDAAPLSSSALNAAHARPHKAPSTSRGVLPPAALEFARSLFSGLPGRDDPEEGESRNGQQAWEHTCTSARQCVPSAGESLPSLGQPSLAEMVTASTAAPRVTHVIDSPAAAALAAAAEGMCQGEVSIWKDLIELEGEAEGVVCGVEKRAGVTVGSFCELEDLFGDNTNLI